MYMRAQRKYGLARGALPGKGGVELADPMENRNKFETSGWSRGIVVEGRTVGLEG
jgi:hypothetical protein